MNQRSTKMAINRSLGRGLDALLSNFDDDDEDELTRPISRHAEPAVPNEGDNVTVELLLTSIDPNVNQPRKQFDEAAMQELVSSIRLHGIISPIIVVRDGARYMIIAGERRYRAAKKAGLKTVPAIIRNYSPQQIKEISLIENLQREDLNPIDTAMAIKQLMDDYNYTQEEVADRIGKSRPAIANTLRLLTLTPPVIDLVAKGKLSPGHARCLVVVNDPNAQSELAKSGIDNKVSVRDFEKLVKTFLNPKPAKKPMEQSIELKELIQQMQRAFATKVSALGNDRRGRIYIDYYNKDDLDRIVEIVELVQKHRSSDIPDLFK